MPDHLTPTELAHDLGLDRRDVMSICIELGVPIFHGRIDKVLFLAYLNATRKQHLRAMSALGAAYFVIFDSSGNMIESFKSADDTARAAQAIGETDGNYGHFEVIAYDANGDVMEPRAPAPASAAG